MFNQYESTLGRAIAMLREGHTLPFSVRRELVVEGFDPAALTSRYFNQL